ncbi:MAG: hypothetical protein ABF562_03220 [Gluconobacter japonicus]|uniref:hypothetical protein n=1 Tax=Gluconobacter japonicus TaxID=376620 RepID=UPI0012E17AA5
MMLRRALARLTHSEFDTVCLERDQAQQRADTMAKTVANQALEIVTLQARLAMFTSNRDANGRFCKRNPQIVER